MLGKELTEVQRIVHDEIHKIQEFSLEPVVPIELVFKNVNIWAELASGKPCRRTYTNKHIIKNISGSFKPGTATAILGSSGSGKTTLLNYISSRMEDSVLKANGEIFINGNLVHSINAVKQRTAYVTQVDIVNANLTPKEQMMYVARLSGEDNPEKKVGQILKILNLEGCQDTRVGDETTRGVSGGERKRTSIGIELITDPSLMFLDEPTTGLDSKSALDVAGILKRLADNGRTIVTTIHCPSAEILDKFDQVICLCRGEIIYYGPPKFITSHFARIGFQVPPLTNPADHLMTIIHEDDIRIQAMISNEELTDKQVEDRFQNRINLFVSTMKEGHKEPVVVKDQPAPLALAAKRKDDVNAFRNFFIVLGRVMVIYFRNPMSFRTKVIQTIGFDLFALILFNNAAKPENNTIQAIMDKGGMVFTVSSTNAFAGIFSNMYTFLPALPTFRRESQNKLYGPLTFYLTHAFFELPIHLLMSALYLVILFWVINIRNDGLSFLWWVILFMCTRFAAMGLGDMLSLVFKNITIVNQMFPLIVVPLFLVSGFMAQVKSIVIYMIVFSYVSFFRFAFQGGILIEFDSGVRDYYMNTCRVFKSSCAGGKSDNNCYINFGSLPASVPRPPLCDPWNIFNFYETELWHNLLILIAIGLFLRIFALIALYQFAREKNVKNDAIPEDIQKQIDMRKVIEVNPEMLKLSPSHSRVESPNAKNESPQHATYSNPAYPNTLYANYANPTAEVAHFGGNQVLDPTIVNAEEEHHRAIVMKSPTNPGHSSARQFQNGPLQATHPALLRPAQAEPQNKQTSEQKYHQPGGN